MRSEAAGRGGREGLLARPALGSPAPLPRRLTATQRCRLFVEIAVAYAVTWHELRRDPLDEVVRRLRATGSPQRGADAEALAEAMRLGWVVVKSLSVLPGDTRCLRRSLVLMRLLTRRGIAAKLVIGTRTEPEFLAHAWIECEGVPVLSPMDGTFGRLVEL